MIKHYRKKPVVVEAVQFWYTPTSLAELYDFFQRPPKVDVSDPDNPILKIETLEGTLTAQQGDYIIKGIRGEFYPCKKDIFEQTYEEIKHPCPTCKHFEPFAPMMLGKCLLFIEHDPAASYIFKKGKPPCEGQFFRPSQQKKEE